MIVSVGIDICKIQRMEKAILRHGDRFLERILAPNEYQRVAGRLDQGTTVAGIFALKEAYSKCLDGAHGVPWHDVQVIHEPSGRPRLNLYGEALKRVFEVGADFWHVSISHDAGAAVAFCVLEKRTI